MNDVKWVELVIFTALFALVSGLGFVASRWRRAKTLDHLEEWGLGGRNFGSWISWFLIGGDLYTAYTSWPCRDFCSAWARSASSRFRTRSYLPDGVRGGAAPVVGGAQARLRHARPTSCAGVMARQRSRS
jgi:hypothetical protein